MGLKVYRSKRRFETTPEPRGRTHAVGDSLRFVVQKHAATHLHFDLRLQIGGVMASWAVPKGPSLNPSDKRLAIHVEDHPIEYNTFEGTIPKGEYGGGTVMIWDQGTWIPDAPDPAAALRKGKLHFTLAGERLKGQWSLNRIKPRSGSAGEKEHWLLIKVRDEHASSKSRDQPDSNDTSVVSGRTMDEIAAKRKATKRPSKRDRTAPSQPTRRPRKEVDLASITGGRRAPLPAQVAPMLCTLVDSAPNGDEWLHEVKYDGYRVLARRTTRGVSLVTRNGHDWTAKFKEVARALHELRRFEAIIDGEIVVLDGSGKSTFQGLQHALRTGRTSGFTYFAFDVLHLDGFDLTGAPLSDRKNVLEQLVPASSSVIRLSEYLAGQGDKLQEAACRLGLEGVVSKKAHSTYQQSRSRDWVKSKCSQRQEFIVIGWTPPEKSRKHFGSLLLAAHDARGRLVYSGRVGTGFNDESLRELAKQLRPLEVDNCPAAVPPTKAESAGVHWVRPVLVAEVSYFEWTADRRLRHPSFIGLRHDKSVEDVRLESPNMLDKDQRQPAKSAESSSKPQRSRKAGAAHSKAESSIVAGVNITHPDRIIFPDCGISKIDLARYYSAVAPSIVPYLAGRPLSVVRCPDGQAKKCFFQKHATPAFGESVDSIAVRGKSGTSDYLSVNTREALVWLVQFGVIEFHPWGSTEADLDKPDQLTFDLDPGEGVEFTKVKLAARRIRTLIESLGLNCFVKLSGGKGLHVVVPIKPDVEWPAAKKFTADVARELTVRHPDEYTATSSKAKRRGRIFIDYLRNDRDATSVAPYSVRARPGAPVSVPLSWNELARIKSASQFSITAASKRAQSKDDPWRDFRASAVSLAQLAGRSTS